MASWLADSGSGGAAEYLPADTLVAGYVSLREPAQLFQEFTAMMGQQNPSFQSELTAVESKLGAGFVSGLTAAVGTEMAFALNGFSATGPAWVTVALANDPVVIDNSLGKLVDTYNAELDSTEQSRRAVLAQENANGRTWKTLTFGGLPFGITWTYDGGYMVTASDRGTAERAIATRYGGSALVWSAAFQSQLPSSAGLHPAAFGWVNTKGALGMLSTLSQSPAAASLLSGRDPVLVVFDGRPEQIHAASRTRLSGVFIDAMLFESLTRTAAPTGGGTMRH